VRTAGVGRSVEELQWDLDNLRTQWDQIEAASKDRGAPFLVYRESDAVTRAMRDYLGDDVGEILVDDQAAYQKAQEYMQRFMPTDAQRRLKMYTDDIPLFTRFQIESQIESAYAHKVQLPSGGSIVVDYTEALVSIDINSARATRGSDIETTATNTNLEAAEEIARQLRIRDIGGLIVIDFIDMESTKNQRDVEDRLRDAMKMDRARIQIGRLSRFGLLEMSRQRLRPSLSDSSHIVCPRCVGIGSIRSVESMALAVLRLIGEELRKDRTSRVIAQVPVEVATYLINEKREWLRQIEDKGSAELIIVPNVNMQTPDYTLRRVRDDETEQPENKTASYLMPTAPVVVEPSSAQDQKPQQEVAAVATILPSTSAPMSAAAPTLPEAAPVAAEPPREIGVLGRFKRWLVGDPTPANAIAVTAETPPASSSTSSSSSSHSRRDRGDRDRGGHRRDRGGRDHRRHGSDGARRDRDASSSEGSRDRDPNRHRGGEGRGGESRGGEGRSAEGGRSREGGDRNRDRNRGPRDGNREGGGRDRGDRPQQAREGGQREGREPREPREPRESREPREPRVAQPQVLDPALAASSAAEATGAVGADLGAAPGVAGGPDDSRMGGERNGERRGRRGRRRGRRGGGGSRDANGNRIPNGNVAEGGGEGGDFGGGESAPRDVDGNRSFDFGSGQTNGAGDSGEHHDHSSHDHSSHEHHSHDHGDHSTERAPRESQRDRGDEQRPREAASSESSSGGGESRSHESHGGQEAHAPAPEKVSHFEPAPKPEGSGQTRPYVVWSSAPPSGGSASGGREE
jgi:ribonuclease E